MPNKQDNWKEEVNKQMLKLAKYYPPAQVQQLKDALWTICESVEQSARKKERERIAERLEGMKLSEKCPYGLEDRLCRVTEDKECELSRRTAKKVNQALTEAIKIVKNE